MRRAVLLCQVSATCSASGAVTIKSTAVAECGLVILTRFPVSLSKGGGLAGCNKLEAGCKTDQRTQQAALCLHVMTLKMQLAHGGHHGSTLTCRTQGHVSCQATAHSSAI